MPFTPAGATAILATQLLATGNIGAGMPKLAAAVANGTDIWLHSLPVITADVGTIGAGVGAIPLIVPNPLLIANFTPAFAGQTLLGVKAPLLILGLSNGLALAFLQALVETEHPSVGVGTAVVRFSPTPAIPAMLAGFAAQGMVGVGAIKLATAIGLGLSNAFTALTLVSPIAGGAGPSPSAGVGIGSIA